MRRWLLSLAIVATVVFATALLLPYWLGPALRLVGPRFGVSVERYERVGYARFTLHHAEYRRAPVRVTVERATATTPVLYLLRRWLGRPDKIEAGAWSVEVVPSVPSSAPSRARGWVPLQSLLRRVADGLDRWLPETTAGIGDVRWKGGALTFSAVHWKDRRITTPELGYRSLHAATCADFATAGKIKVSAVDSKFDLAAEVTSEGNRVSGNLRWAGQSAQLDSVFQQSGWLPREAHVRAEGWALPAERVRLGAQYATIRGTGSVDWVNGTLSANIGAKGEPRPESAAPPLTVALRGHGRPDAFVADALDIRLPGIVAALTQPVAIDRRGNLQSPESQFRISVDLVRQPWFPGRGEIQGVGHISPGQQGMATIAFSLSGERLSVGDVGIARLETKGRFEWPELMLESVKLDGENGERATARGSCNFQQRTLRDGHVSGAFDRNLVATLFPRFPKFAAASLELTATGTWPQLDHRGWLSAEQWVLPPLKPIDLRAEWTGRGTQAESIEIQGTAGALAVRAAGSADAHGARISRLSLEEKSLGALVATTGFAVRWTPAVAIGPVHLEGGATRIDASVTWARAGRAEVAVRALSSEWPRALFELPAPRWTLESGSLAAHWDNSPATYEAQASVAVPLGAEQPANFLLQVRGDGEGLEVQTLRAAQQSAAIVEASGRLPIVLRPAQPSWFELRSDGPLVIDAATAPNPLFWDKLAQLTGVMVEHPDAQVHLKGTFSRPTGAIEIKADRLAPLEGRFAWQWPRIERIDLKVAGDPDGFRVDRLRLDIDGQEVRAEGHVPVAATHWLSLFRDPRQLAESGDLRVTVPGADLAAIARYVPAYLAPSGRLEMDLTLKSNQTVQGYVRVRDAASRPLGPLGVLQEVNAEVRFDGRAVQLEHVTARMGGQLVTLQGRADLPAYETPSLDFTLKGENLPFVRRTGLLVRGDLDLTLKTLPSGRTEIGGEVRLRDSLFVADLRALLPAGTKGGPVRPPYFAIEIEPLAAWGLAVQVHGERFMRLRTPVFNGTASARVRLDGVLANPRATGQAVIDEGNIRLPFANFEVRQGEVRLNPDQPEPQLMVTGTTRRYGYDLRLELAGAASNPNLTFTSSPPLEAEQVLLMVMAGQAPHNEVATTDRQRVARFGAFFGQSLLGSLGGDAGGADRLTISSGENISAQGRETYNIEYRLGNRWALTGEYDEFDEYYGGVKWRIYQKGGRSGDAKR